VRDLRDWAAARGRPGAGAPPPSPSPHSGRDSFPWSRCRPGGDARGLVRDAEHARYLRSLRADRCRAVELRREAALLLVRRGRDGISAGRCVCRPGRDLPCGPGGDNPCIHRGSGPVPAALCLPAEADPAGDEGRCGRGDRDVREK